jgi:muconate cycloisomerase
MVAQRSHEDALNLIREEACDVFLPYITKSPGIHNTLKIAAIAEAAGIPCALSAGGVLSRIAALHVMATMKNLLYAEWWSSTGASCKPRAIDLPFGLHEELIEDPPFYAEKGLEVPSKPGLGIELDWDKVEKYRVA